MRTFLAYMNRVRKIDRADNSVNGLHLYKNMLEPYVCKECKLITSKLRNKADEINAIVQS